MNLVTGATGHLGNVLIRELLSRGEEVRALVLPGDTYESLDGLDVELSVGNILDPPSLERAMEGASTVYHLAGVISIIPGAEEIMEKVNVEGAGNVARAALKAGVRRMVHTSSIHAYRREPHGITINEKTPLAPYTLTGSYDRSKARGALAVLEVVREGLDAVIACPTGIIGPHDYLGSEIGKVISSFTVKKPHFLVHGAFDFVDVRDVARGLILAAAKGRRGEAYIFSGKLISLGNLKKITQKAAAVRSPGLFVPMKVAMFFTRFTQHIYRITSITPQYTTYSLQTITDNAVFSCEKARRELGYSPRPIEETIHDYLVWRKENYHKYYRRRQYRRRWRLFWKPKKV